MATVSFNEAVSSTLFFFQEAIISRNMFQSVGKMLIAIVKQRGFFFVNYCAALDECFVCLVDQKEEK